MDLKQIQMMPPWNWPADTDQRLSGILRNDRTDDSDRMIAAELAGEYTVINDDLAGILLEILCNVAEPDDLRARAAISLGPGLEAADWEDEGDFDDAPFSWEMFLRIQEALHNLYADVDVPLEIRRRCLESSVRAPRDWHSDAVLAAYAEGSEAWKLTAVMCMQHVSGFDEQILEALACGNPEIQIEAMDAAGAWPVDSAWPQIIDILDNGDTDKDLLFAAMEAAVNIRPDEAILVLGDFLDHDDEDIASAASEAIGLAEEMAEAGDDDDDEDDEGEALDGDDTVH